MKNRITFLFVISSLISINAQKKKDSLKLSNIEEVIITGQYSGRSINKSIHKVEVIRNEDIQRMAVNNVAEVLNQTLNILIIPEKNSGDSKANIMGLGAEYTKILVDNIPLIGDTGLGNNIDLTKINLDNVERIEIVKGSMGVEFGNNAVAGVINIITKKSSKKKWNVYGFVQEETVGKEYDWIDYGKGKHIQSLGITHNISDRWYVNANFNRTDFQGFWNVKKGKNHFGQDNLRGYEWQPKEQINPSVLVRYQSPKTYMYYKADYLNEEVNYYNPIVNTKNLGGGERTFISTDRNYLTSRMLHHFNIDTHIFEKAKLTIDASYQKQTRKSEDYLFDIPARAVSLSKGEETFYQAETYYSKGTISNFLSSNKTDIQLGYEGDYTRGFSNWNTGNFNGKNIIKDILTLGIFASAEIPLSSDWFLRPGVRVNFSDTFKSTANFSFVVKNNINENSEFRASIGTSNKNPNFEQLYTYFVDSNHNIQGNAGLRPEKSYTGSLYYSIFGNKDSDWKWKLDASTMYLQVRDKVMLATVSTTPLEFKFMNVNNVQSWLSTLSGQIKNKNFGINIGGSVLAESQSFNRNTNKFRYYPEANSSIYYNLLKTNTLFSVYYKIVGKRLQIMENNFAGVTEYTIRDQKGFSLLDATISQKFWKNRLGLTLGVRNILNVSSVQNITSNASIHGGAEDSRMLFYGRSYFGKINFNF